MRAINLLPILFIFFLQNSCKGSTEKSDSSTSVHINSPAQIDNEGSKKYALLVGINEYKYVTDLDGCENDVLLMENLLVNKFGFKETNIRKLINEEATRDNVLNAFKDHFLGKVKANDIVVFHYSGHGAQIRNLSKEESGEMDDFEEILVTYDFEDSPNKAFKGILDDEINGLLVRLSQITDNITFVFDACNSGGAAKSLNKIRRIEAKPRYFNNIENFAVGTRNLRTANTNFAFLAACKANQFAYEMEAPNDSIVGSFTYFLTQELSKNSGPISYEDIIGSVKTNVKSNNAFQFPVLYGTETNKEVFGITDLTPVRHALITSVSDDKVTLNIGGLVGASIGSEFEVYSPQEDLRSRDKNPIGKIVITKVGSNYSEASIVGKHSISQINSKAVETKHHFKGIELKVYLEGDWTPNRELFDSIDNLDFASISRNKNRSDLLIKKSDGGYEIYLSNNVLEPKKKFPINTSKEDILEYVEKWASWFTAVKISNPKSDLKIGVEIDSEIENSGSKGLIDLLTNVDHKFKVGESFNLRVTNESNKSIYVYLLDIVDTPEVQSLCMADFQNGIELLPPKESITLQLETTLRLGVQKTTEIIKVIASVDGEPNLDYLTLGCYDENSKNVKPGKSSFYDVNSWAVVDKLIQIERN